MKIEFTNQQEVQKRLTDLSDAVRGPLLVVAAKAGATLIKEEARRLAPRGATGNLIKSIKIRTIQKTATEAAVVVGPTAWYAHFVEFGTRRSRAQPFMRPAIESKKSEVSEVIHNMLAQPFSDNPFEFINIDAGRLDE